MSRETFNLETARSSANANASALLGFVLTLCDELERTASERDKLRDKIEQARAILIEMASMTPKDEDGACEWCGWSGAQKTASHVGCAAMDALDFVETH